MTWDAWNVAHVELGLRQYLNFPIFLPLGLFQLYFL